MPQLFLVDCSGGDLRLRGTRSGARELPSVKRSDAHFASSAVRELPIPPVCPHVGCGHQYCSRTESPWLSKVRRRFLTGIWPSTHQQVLQLSLFGNFGDFGNSPTPPPIPQLGFQRS